MGFAALLKFVGSILCFFYEGLTAIVGGHFDEISGQDIGGGVDVGGI